MARREIGRLGDAMVRDPELQAKLEQAKTLDEMIAVARAAGYSFTAEEVREEVAARKQELTEEQLERVAGGHTGGVNFLMGDGSVRFLQTAIQLKILIGL